MLIVFPEGGSHDRTDLLPLKAGACIMALGAQQKYNIKVKIVCAGINYYKQNAFSSNVYVQFNKPISIDDQLTQLYSSNKRQAINILLEKIETNMR